MTGYKLEKNVKMYKAQFEKLSLMVLGDHRFERFSMELDAILFRVRYMIKHELDLDMIDAYKEKFAKLTIDLKNAFGDIVEYLLTDIIDFSEGDIEDFLVQDVKMDSVYVEFKLIVISRTESYLEHVDQMIPDDILNPFPDEYFRIYNESYNDGIAKAYPELFENRHQDDVGTGNDGDIFVHNFTFQTTERCSLNCTYCYQFNKSPMRMNFDTAKKFIDNLLEDKYGYINRYNSPAIIIEFIGGEPLLEIELTRKIYEYFLEKCYELDHPWFALHRLSICSNGLAYFDDAVQDFFNEYAQMISFNISIDGNRELHDACRIQPNGEGSYDIGMAALNHYNAHHTPERNSKMTLAPSNIKYLFDSVIDFINNDMHSINLNCIFEEGWNRKTATEEYYQLKKLADYLIDNDLEHLFISIFNERPEGPQPPTNDGNFCGGTGSMLAMRPNGDFYPCLRYMPSSVGPNVKDLCIGNVNSGIVGREQDSEILSMLDYITRRSQSNDVCYGCPIGNDCAWCSALAHTVYGTPDKRPMFICIQMIAEALANVYYWNRLNIKHPEYKLGVRKNMVPTKWMRLVVDYDEIEELSLLEIASIIATMDSSRT